MKPIESNESKNEKILLDFRFQKSGKVKRYKIKKQQKLEQAMALWCKEMGFPREHVEFYWKQQRINGYDNAELYENHVINVISKNSSKLSFFMIQ